MRCRRLSRTFSGHSLRTARFAGPASTRSIPTSRASRPSEVAVLSAWFSQAPAQMEWRVHLASSRLAASSSSRTPRPPLRGSAERRPCRARGLDPRHPDPRHEFFPDPEGWEALEKDVLHQLLSDRDRRSSIRASTPACATGEEAYSVTILLSEATERANTALDFQVFATDASPEILARASRGVFSEIATRTLP